MRANPQFNKILFGQQIEATFRNIFVNLNKYFYIIYDKNRQTMRKVCDHFLSLKQEKIGNFIKKTQIRCSNHSHISQEYNLCLHCGETRCDSSEEFVCSEQHSQSNRHFVVLKLLSLQIFCFHCQKYIDEIIVDWEGSKAEKKKIEKTNELKQKIFAMTEKHLSTEKFEKRRKKIEKKVEQMDEPIVKEHKHKKEYPLRIFGLANIGNTCYFNSILQCLYATIDVHELYHQVQFKDDINLVFRKFLRNTDKVFCPKNLFSLICKSHKAFKGMDQQDAFELYVLLLNSLIESTEKKQGKNHPNMSQIFGFTLASKLSCLNCGKKSWNKDMSLGLNIPIAKKSTKKIEFVQDHQLIPEEEIGEQGLQIPEFEQSNNFLDNFFDPELFTKANHFKCEQCEESNAIHKFYIKQAPKILTINFKRFTNSGMKLNSRVSTPKEISLSNVLLRKNPCKYQLYASVVHSGSSSGGHYVAYTKRNDEWFYFSDSHCKPGGSVKVSQPYIVFYKQVQTEKIQPLETETVQKVDSQIQTEVKTQKPIVLQMKKEVSRSSSQQSSNENK